MRILIILLISFTTVFLSPNVLAIAKIQFPGATAKGPRLLIAAVGDVILHKSLQIKVIKQGYQSLWQQALPYIRKADIAYANIEGPMAQGVHKSGRLVKDPGHRWDNQVYSSYPLFNYHPNLAKALKTAGFTLVSMANNHSLDRYSIGIDRSIEALNQVGLKHIGTRKRNAQHPWYVILHKKGFRIAWIACAAHTNGLKDLHHQVLYCYQRHDRKLIIHMIKQLHHKVDAIIVSPHWGTQYQHYPNRNQIHFAHQVLNAGAMAVIGGHPHVLLSLIHI